jgi:hypothetical protein
LVKALVLTAINATDEVSAFAAFRSDWPAEHPGKAMTNEQLKQLLVAFLTKHPQLDGVLCTDQGIRLMYLDSCIAASVLREFTQQSIPVLSVHDSFIIDYRHVGALKQAMERSAQEVAGGPLSISSSGPGLDEFQTHDPWVVLDFVTWRQTPRCEGYLRRLEASQWGRAR